MQDLFLAPPVWFPRTVTFSFANRFLRSRFFHFILASSYVIGESINSLMEGRSIKKIREFGKKILIGQVVCRCIIENCTILIFTRLT